MEVRNILFRGIILDTDDRWIHGHHVKRGSRHFIETINHEYEVKPETVGQFTGLLDADGEEVWEGDIIKMPETDFNAEIIGIVEYDSDRAAFVLRSPHSHNAWSLDYVFGNRQFGNPKSVTLSTIYDKPYLINH